MPPPLKRIKALSGKTFFLFNAFFFLSVSLFPQTGFDKNCQEAYKAALSLRFGESRTILNTEKKLVPGNYIPVYLENYIGFMTVFIGEDQAAYKEFAATMPSRMEMIGKMDHNSPWYLYCRGNMNLQMGVVKLKFGEYRSAATDINRAYKDLKENKNRFPDFLPTNTGLGMIHILVGIIPDSYNWLLKIFGLEGDIRLGLAEITSVSGYNGDDPAIGLLRIEALFNIALLDASLGKDSRNALQVIREFDKRKAAFPDSTNSLMIFIRSGIYMKSGMNDQAIATLSQYRQDPGEYPFHYLYYQLGLAKLNRQDADADRYLILFLKNFHGQNYIKSAWQKLAWSSLLNGNQQKFTGYMDKIPLRGKSYVDADKQADKEAKNKVVPNITLLKARLLFDGGYYDHALQVMQAKNVQESLSSARDRLEYSYRLGRIYQAKGDIAHALSFYETTIQNGTPLPYYFAANAALQSGLIYEAKGDLVNAEKKYRLCLSMDYDEYKNSLSQKAKAGLKRVKQ